MIDEYFTGTAVSILHQPQNTQNKAATNQRPDNKREPITAAVTKERQPIASGDASAASARSANQSAPNNDPSSISPSSLNYGF